MKWSNRTFIYAPDYRMPWAKHSALTPTPVWMGDFIRVYAGFRDDSGISRIGYVDVDANNPSKVIAVSEKPVLDIGMPGMFDDNGVILGDVVKVGPAWYMYYVGFQLPQRVKFLAFTGVAISRDGATFTRIQNVPIMDRSEEGLYIRAIHTVLVEEAVWKVWYAAGNGWSLIEGNPYPQYEIKYTESTDGIRIPDIGTTCIRPRANEYRIGRPRVFKRGKVYSMLFTKGTLQKDYLPGFAESSDGKNWIRKDGLLGLDLSESGWDCRNICYPSILQYKEKIYLFYNGNDMGRTGFGYAELASWD